MQIIKTVDELAAWIEKHEVYEMSSMDNGKNVQLRGSRCKLHFSCCVAQPIYVALAPRLQWPHTPGNTLSSGVLMALLPASV
jgi:hypothetical protein